MSDLELKPGAGVKFLLRLRLQPNLLTPCRSGFATRHVRKEDTLVNEYGTVLTEQRKIPLFQELVMPLAIIFWLVEIIPDPNSGHRIRIFGSTVKTLHSTHTDEVGDEAAASKYLLEAARIRHLPATG